MAVGVIGAFIGGLILQLLGVNTTGGFNLGSLLLLYTSDAADHLLFLDLRRDPVLYEKTDCTKNRLPTKWEALL